MTGCDRRIPIRPGLWARGGEGQMKKRSKRKRRPMGAASVLNVSVRSNVLVRTRSLPVLLNARGAQTGEAVLVDRGLPGEEFLYRERIAAARFFKRKQAAAHGCDDLGLT